MAKRKKAKYYVRPDGLHEAIRRINGKRIAFRGKTDAEVERKMLAYQGIIKNGRSFCDIADEWWYNAEVSLAENTKSSYLPAYRRAKEQFADTPCKTIQPPDIQQYINTFSRGYAQKTVANQLLILNLIFSYAVVNGDIEINPCTYVKIPKGLKKSHRESACTEDEEKVKQYANQWLLPYFILCTGLRKGEALALTNSDFSDGWVSVSKSIYFMNNRPYVKRPKTESGERVVPVPDCLKPYFPKHWKGYLFSCDNGKTPLTKKQYARLWYKMREETGIRCTAHQLRHSYASFIYDAGIRGKDAQDILGHAQLSTTMDIYTHLRNDRKEHTAKLLNAAMQNL